VLTSPSELAEISFGFRKAVLRHFCAKFPQDSVYQKLFELIDFRQELYKKRNLDVFETHRLLQFRKTLLQQYRQNAVTSQTDEFADCIETGLTQQVQ